MRPPATLLLLLLLAAAASSSAPRPAAAQDDPQLPDVGAPDCGADASTANLTASRSLALSLAGQGGFVAATAVLIAVGSGSRCDAGGGAGAGPRLDLAYEDDGNAADGSAENDDHSSLSLLLYLQCVHSGVASCRRNEDDATSGGLQAQMQGQSQQPGVDGTLARACLVVVRVPPPSSPSDDEPPPSLPCSLAQGGKYTFLLKEEDDPRCTSDACGGQGRYVFAGHGIYDSVRPGSGLGACAPWPGSPKPPGPPEQQGNALALPPSSLGELGSLLMGAGGRCPGGLEARKGGSGADAWAAACPLEEEEQPQGAPRRPALLPPGLRRGACDPSSGVACLPRQACPARMMAGQVLLPGVGVLPPPRGDGGGGGDGGEGAGGGSGSGGGGRAAAASAAAYIDRVTGMPLPGCGAGYERARAQGVRVKRMRAAQSGGGEGRGGGGVAASPLPRKLGLDALAQAAGVAGGAADGGGGGTEP